MENLFILGVITPQVADIAAIIISLAILVVGYRFRKILHSLEDAIITIGETIEINGLKSINWWKAIIAAFIYVIATILLIKNGYNATVVIVTTVWLAILTITILILYKEGGTRAILTVAIMGIFVAFVLTRIETLWPVFVIAFFASLFLEEILGDTVKNIKKYFKKKLGLF